MASQAKKIAAQQRPTVVRYWVIVFAITLAVVTYIDRVSISFAAPAISKDLNLDSRQMGWVLWAFTSAYALFEIPGGYLGDRIGPRNVLMRIVLWWSFFTAATGWVINFMQLLIARFLFGMGEAGCFPNLTKAFTTWLPTRERVRAQSMMWLAARWGGAFTPPLVKYVMDWVGWRHAFEIFGCMGVVWAVLFYWWYRNDPRQNPKLNAAELELLRESSENATGHGDVPWGLFVRSPQVWLLCAQYFFLSYGWYFYITWLPTYLKEGRHLDITRMALFGIVPLLFGGVGNPVSAWAASMLKGSVGGLGQARRIMAYIGFAGASGFLLLSVNAKDPLLAILAIGMSSFCNDLVMPGSWGAAMDVGGTHAGSLSGAMNMCGNFGGSLLPLAIGYILYWTNNNWDLILYLSAAVYLLGIVCWKFLDPVTPLESKPAHA
jgi:MFS family permease